MRKKKRTGEIAGREEDTNGRSRSARSKASGDAWRRSGQNPVAGALLSPPSLYRGVRASVYKGRPCMGLGGIEWYLHVTDRRRGYPSRVIRTPSRAPAFTRLLRPPKPSRRRRTFVSAEAEAEAPIEKWRIFIIHAYRCRGFPFHAHSPFFARPPAVHDFQRLPIARKDEIHTGGIVAPRLEQDEINTKEGQVQKSLTRISIAYLSARS